MGTTGKKWSKAQRAKFAATVKAKGRGTAEHTPKYRKKKRKLSLREIGDGMFLLTIKD